MFRWPSATSLLSASVLLWLVAGMGSLQAAPLRERLASARGEMADLAQEGEISPTQTRLPRQIQVIRDVAYGGNRQQRFDVYAPRDARDAPVIFLVHGGAWRVGDKAMSAVVQNKVSRWVPKGFIVISTNYRMLPDADPLEQAWDVAQALSAAQARCKTWGGNRQKFVLMGHSAGAHLVALINASPVLATGKGATPWLGAVSLDSASLDVVSTMEGDHLRLYDRAFGRDPGFWQAVSPWHQMSKGSAPLLAVCSSLRQDACPQAEAYQHKATSQGLRAEVLPQKLRHGDINARLGEPGAYTQAVEQFLGSLDPDIAQRLSLHH